MTRAQARLRRLLSGWPGTRVGLAQRLNPRNRSKPGLLDIRSCLYALFLLGIPGAGDHNIANSNQPRRSDHDQ